MSREIISTPDAPNAIGTYSQAVKCGSTVYMSGQIALDPATMEIVGMDDIHDTLAIGLSVFNPNPVKRGLQGTVGWRQDWGKKGRRIKHSRRHA